MHRLNLNVAIPLPESISYILSLMEGLGGGKGFFPAIATGGDIDKMLRSTIPLNPMIARQITFMLRLNETQIGAIPEHIKNKVLDWACDLEAAGVTGTGISFSKMEIEKAHSITFNISGCHIDQLNNMGTNQRETR